MAESAILPEDRNMSGDIHVPADFAPHERTIMAWAVHREWGAAREDVEHELDSVIRAIATDEPITLLTPPDLVAAAKQRSFGPDVEILPAPVDDIWMRDICPVFAKRHEETVAIDLNFNGWDGSRPPRPGDRLARIFDFKVQLIGTPFIGEGGAFITDGNGLAVTTRSCLLSRNPHLSEAEITDAFHNIGMHTVLWLNGDRNEPVTTSHPDGFMTFLPDGGIAIESIETGRGSRLRKQDTSILKRSTASGMLDRVIDFDARPNPAKHHGPLFAGTYLNLFVTNRTVLTAHLGDKTQDQSAKHQLRFLFPNRDITMLKINAILNGGGGIRCLTQPVPA